MRIKPTTPISTPSGPCPCASAWTATPTTRSHGRPAAAVSNWTGVRPHGSALAFATPDGPRRYLVRVTAVPDFDGSQASGPATAGREVPCGFGWRGRRPGLGSDRASESSLWPSSLRALTVAGPSGEAVLIRLCAQLRLVSGAGL